MPRAAGRKVSALRHGARPGLPRSAAPSVPRPVSVTSTALGSSRWSQAAVFFLCLISFGISSSRFCHLAAHSRSSPLFKARRVSAVRLRHTLTISSSVAGFLGLFHLPAIAGDGAGHVGAQLHLWHAASRLWGACSATGSPGPTVVLLFTGHGLHGGQLP